MVLIAPPVSGGNRPTSYKHYVDKVDRLDLGDNATEKVKQLTGNIKDVFELDINVPASVKTDLEDLRDALKEKIKDLSDVHVDKLCSDIDDKIDEIDALDWEAASSGSHKKEISKSEGNDLIEEVEVILRTIDPTLADCTDLDDTKQFIKNNEREKAREKIKKLRNFKDKAKELQKQHNHLKDALDSVEKKLTVLADAPTDAKLDDQTLKLEKAATKDVTVDLKAAAPVGFPASFDMFDLSEKGVVDGAGNTHQLTLTPSGGKFEVKVAGSTIGDIEFIGTDQFKITIKKYDELPSEIKKIMPIDIDFKVKGRNDESKVSATKTFKLTLEKPAVNDAEIDSYYQKLAPNVNGKLKEQYEKNYEKVSRKYFEKACANIDGRFSSLDDTDKSMFWNLINGKLRDEEYTFINAIRPKANWTQGEVLFPGDKDKEGHVFDKKDLKTDEWNFQMYFKHMALKKLKDDGFQGSEEDLKNEIEKKLGDEKFVEAVMEKGMESAGWSENNPVSIVDKFNAGGGNLVTEAEFTTRRNSCQTSFEESTIKFLDDKDAIWEAMRKGWFEEKKDMTTHTEKLEDIFNQFVNPSMKDAFIAWAKAQKDNLGNPIYDFKDDKKWTPEVRDLAFQLLVGEYNAKDEDNPHYAKKYEYKDTTGTVRGSTDPDALGCKNAFVHKKDDFVKDFMEDIMKDKGLRSLEGLNGAISENLDTRSAKIIAEKLKAKLDANQDEMVPHLTNIRDHIVHNEDRRNNVPVYAFKEGRGGREIKEDITTVRVNVNLVDVRDFYDANPGFEQKVAARVERMKDDQKWYQKVGRWFSIGKTNKQMKEEARKEEVKSNSSVKETQQMAQRVEKEVEMGLVDTASVIDMTNSSLKTALQKKFEEFYGSEEGMDESELHKDLHKIVTTGGFTESPELAIAAKGIVDKAHEKREFIIPLTEKIKKMKKLLGSDGKGGPKFQEEQAKFQKEVIAMEQEFKEKHAGKSPAILRGLLGKEVQDFNTDDFMELLSHEGKLIRMATSNEVKIGKLKLIKGNQVRSADNINRRDYDPKKGGIEKTTTQRFAQWLQDNPGMRMLGFVGILSLVSMGAAALPVGLAVGIKVGAAPLLATVCAACEANGWFKTEIQELNKKIAKMSEPEKAAFFQKLQSDGGAWGEKYATAFTKDAAKITVGLKDFSMSTLGRGQDFALAKDKWNKENKSVADQIAQAYSLLKFRQENKYRQMMVVKDEAIFNELHQTLDEAFKRYNEHEKYYNNKRPINRGRVSGWADTNEIIDGNESGSAKTLQMERDVFSTAMRKNDKKVNKSAFRKALGVGVKVGATTLVVQEAMHWFTDMLSTSSTSTGGTTTTQTGVNTNTNTGVVPSNGGGTQIVTQIINPDLNTEMSTILTQQQYDAFVTAANDPNNTEYLWTLVNNHVTGGNIQQTNDIVNKIFDSLTNDQATLQAVADKLTVPTDCTNLATYSNLGWDAATVHDKLTLLKSNPASIMSLPLDQRQDLMNLTFRTGFDYDGLFTAQQVQVQTVVNNGVTTVVNNTVPVNNTGIPVQGSNTVVYNPMNGQVSVNNIPVDTSTGALVLGTPEFTQNMVTSLGQAKYDALFQSLNDSTNVNQGLYHVMTDAGLSPTEQGQVISQILGDPTLFANMQNAITLPTDSSQWMTLDTTLTAANFPIHNSSGAIVPATGWDNSTLQDMFTKFKTNPGLLHQTQIEDIIKIMDGGYTGGTTIGQLDPQTMLPVDFIPGPVPPTRSGLIGSVAGKVGDAVNRVWKKTGNPLIHAASWAAGLIPKIGRKQGISSGLK